MPYGLGRCLGAGVAVFDAKVRDLRRVLFEALASGRTELAKRGHGKREAVSGQPRRQIDGFAQHVQAFVPCGAEGADYRAAVMDLDPQATRPASRLHQLLDSAWQFQERTDTAVDVG